MFKKKFVRILLLAAICFTALFLFRFIYGYTTGHQEAGEEFGSDFFSDVENLKKNYASDSYKYKRAAPSAMVGQPSHEVNVNQKYEKTARVRARSTSFEEEEKKARTTIKDFNAIIQYERITGNKGSRELQMLIGVNPERFDSFYIAVLKIGKTSFKEITKVDKTNEFKDLNAKKTSLEITRQSLLEIKKQSGRIDEFINLQNRILEIEKELQDLGVLLGDFDEENEFCTVRFSLSETKEVKISMLHRLKVSFEWSVKYFLLVTGILAVVSMLGFFILLITDQVLPSIVSKFK